MGGPGAVGGSAGTQGAEQDQQQPSAPPPLSSVPSRTRRSMESARRTECGAVSDPGEGGSDSDGAGSEAGALLGQEGGGPAALPDALGLYYPTTTLDTDDEAEAAEAEAQEEAAAAAAAEAAAKAAAVGPGSAAGSGRLDFVLHKPRYFVDGIPIMDPRTVMAHNPDAAEGGMLVLTPLDVAAGAGECGAAGGSTGDGPGATDAGNQGHAQATPAAEDAPQPDSAAGAEGVLDGAQGAAAAPATAETVVVGENTSEAATSGASCVPPSPPTAGTPASATTDPAHSPQPGEEEGQADHPHHHDHCLSFGALAARFSAESSVAPDAVSISAAADNTVAAVAGAEAAASSASVAAAADAPSQPDGGDPATAAQPVLPAAAAEAGATGTQAATTSTSTAVSTAPAAPQLTLPPIPGPSAPATPLAHSPVLSPAASAQQPAAPASDLPAKQSVASAVSGCEDGFDELASSLTRPLPAGTAAAAALGSSSGTLSFGGAAAGSVAQAAAAAVAAAASPAAMKLAACGGRRASVSIAGDGFDELAAARSTNSSFRVAREATGGQGLGGVSGLGPSRLCSSDAGAQAVRVARALLSVTPLATSAQTEGACEVEGPQDGDRPSAPEALSGVEATREDGAVAGGSSGTAGETASAIISAYLSGEVGGGSAASGGAGGGLGGSGRGGLAPALSSTAGACGGASAADCDSARVTELDGSSREDGVALAAGSTRSTGTYVLPVLPPPPRAAVAVAGASGVAAAGGGEVAVAAPAYDVGHGPFGSITSMPPGPTGADSGCEDVRSGGDRSAQQ